MLEPAGAVFMPAAGARYQFTAYDGVYYDWFNNENAIDCALWQADLNYSPYFVCGSYWTSSQFLDGNPVGIGNAVALKIVTHDMDPAYTSGFIANTIRCKGYAVRLVSDE